MGALRPTWVRIPPSPPLFRSATEEQKNSHMALYHVAITGRDRRHLTALGAKLRVVVVGYRETKRGIVVDAYVPAEKIGSLERKGYAVTRLEEIEAHDSQR